MGPVHDERILVLYSEVERVSQRLAEVGYNTEEVERQ